MIGYRRRGTHLRPSAQVHLDGQLDVTFDGRLDGPIDALRSPRDGRDSRAKRRVRAPRTLSAFAVLACMALALVPLATPPAPSQAAALAASFHRASQSYSVNGEATAAVARDGYGVTKAAPKPAAVPKAKAGAPAVGVPDPGTAQAIAFDMVAARGWGQSEFDCLVALWNRESHWNVYSNNTHTGAYGIPQALPGSKMGSVGADWATNPATQITWGLGYISGRYGTPCGAWGHSQSSGWY